MIIDSIDIYRLKNDKVVKDHINIKFFDIKDLKYMLLFDETIKGFFINIS